MRKNLHNIIYSVICVIGLMAMFSMVSSCSDSEEQQASETGFSKEEQLQIQNQIQAIRGVLKRLTGVEELEADFYQQTYTPTYGKVLNEANPFVRSVKTNEQKFAYEQFELMVADKNLITPTTDGYSVVFKYPSKIAQLANREEFGKLTYHQGDGSTRIAYVDVDIPSIPNLQRIDFVPSELWGDNSIVKNDTTAFKYGELVYFNGKEDRGEGYWLCVREYNGGQQDGILVHLNEGFKSGFCKSYSSGYSWSAYFDTTEEDVKAYMNFLWDGGELLKQNRKFLLDRGKKEYVLGMVINLGILDVDNICPSRFLENDNVYNGDKPAWIITKTYKGDQSHWFFWHWSVCEHLEIPAYSKNGRGEFSGWSYTTSSDWSEQEGKCYVYTINAIHFTNKIPDGMISKYNPAAHYGEDDE